MKNQFKILSNALNGKTSTIYNDFLTFQKLETSLVLKQCINKRRQH